MSDSNLRCLSGRCYGNGCFACEWMFTELGLWASGFPVLNISRLPGCVPAVLQIWMCGRDDCGGQRKHMALCVVGSDMSRLSIDWDICLRQLLWVKISNGTVVIQCQGSLCSFVLVGSSAVKHICLTLNRFYTLENVLFSVLSLHSDI